MPDSGLALHIIGDRVWIIETTDGHTRTFELTGGNAHIIWIGSEWRG
jgi:hypothetical protein